MESTAWRGTGRPRARDPWKVSVPPGSSEEAGRASLSGVHRAHLPDAAAWPGLAPERRGSQASMALFFLPRGLTARGVSATLSRPTSLWARTAHLPVSPGQLSGQPQTVTSKRAGRVTPRQPGPGSTRPSPRLSLSYLYGLRLRLAALHAAPAPPQTLCGLTPLAAGSQATHPSGARLSNAAPSEQQAPTHTGPVGTPSGRNHFPLAVQGG